MARRRARPSRCSPTRSSSTWARSSRRSPGRSARRTGCCSSEVDDEFNARARRHLSQRRTTRASPVEGEELRHRQRRRRDRRDHQLHQHLQPVGADRRRPRRAQGAREGPHAQAVGQDQPRAGMPGGHRLSRTRAASARISTRSASTWSAMAARPASAIRARCPSRSARRSTTMTWSPSASSRATATSKAASRPTARQLPRLAAAGRRLCAQGHGPRGHGQRADRHRVATASRSILKDIWPINEEVRALIDAHVHSEMFRRRYADVYRGDERWREIEVTGGETYGWPARVDLHPEPALFRGHDDDAGAGRPTSSARGRWRSSAIRSPPTTSRRPARSSPTARPAAICSSTRSAAATSTATARAAAIMK